MQVDLVLIWGRGVAELPDTSLTLRMQAGPCTRGLFTQLTDLFVHLLTRQCL